MTYIGHGDGDSVAMISSVYYKRRWANGGDGGTALFPRSSGGKLAAAASVMKTWRRHGAQYRAASAYRRLSSGVSGRRHQQHGSMARHGAPCCSNSGGMSARRKTWRIRRDSSMAYQQQL